MQHATALSRVKKVGFHNPDDGALLLARHSSGWHVVLRCQRLNRRCGGVQRGAAAARAAMRNAMVMGRAVITTDAPGCRETVVEGDNGFMVPVQSADALEQAMLKFVQDPSLAARMGQRARKMAEDKYHVHKVNAVMLREVGLHDTLCDET